MKDYVERICLYCRKPFLAKNYGNYRDGEWGIYCSKKCWCEDRKNKTKAKLDNEGYLSISKRRSHRIIMEEYLGRKLDRNEIVHHLNGIKTDNRVENLEVLSRGKHFLLHYHQKQTKCSHPDCKTLCVSKFNLCQKHYRSWWKKNNAIKKNQN